MQATDAWPRSRNLGILCAMAAPLDLDPSRPCQVGDDFLALWLPRGRGRDDLAPGLLAAIEGDKVRVSWRTPAGGPPVPAVHAVLELEMTTGAVVERNGGKLPVPFAKFFAEPLPFWVLDALWARWQAPRRHAAIDWQSQALRMWEPGTLLPTMLAFPDERPDRYLVDGKVYQVDPMFCVAPDCTCTETRLSVLAVAADNQGLREIGSAQLPPETMVPVDFDGEPEHHNTFIQVYLEWRRRNVPADARLLELRELTRQRGRELHRLAAAGARPGAGSQLRAPGLPPSRAWRPGRNAPCPCGSGQKYKRCCGK